MRCAVVTNWGKVDNMVKFSRFHPITLYFPRSRGTIPGGSIVSSHILSQICVIKIIQPSASCQTDQQNMSRNTNGAHMFRTWNL